MLEDSVVTVCFCFYNIISGNTFKDFTYNSKKSIKLASSIAGQEEMSLLVLS